APWRERPGRWPAQPAPRGAAARRRPAAPGRRTGRRRAAGTIRKPTRSWSWSRVLGESACDPATQAKVPGAGAVRWRDGIGSGNGAMTAGPGAREPGTGRGETGRNPAPADSGAPEVLAAGSYLRLVRRCGWEYAERANASAAVIVVAVTPEDRILFVEQQRIPIRCATIEMPAGLVGDTSDSDTIEAAAARELEEETGWRAGRIEFLMIGPSSAGLSTEMIAF